MPEAFVKAAIEQDVKILGFSGHSPMPFETVYSIAHSDYESYLDCISQLKQKYKGQIQILSGLEVDFLPNQLNATHNIFSRRNFDFLISSVHYGGHLPSGEVWFIDGPRDYFEDGFKQIYNNDVKKYAQAFFKHSHEMLSIGGFDIVGHLDKLYQHGHRYFSVDEKWYRNLVIELCEACRDRDKIVEINTKSFTRLGFFYPHQSFFKEMSALKIPITLNSDAHDPDKVCNSFQKAATLLANAGYKRTWEWVNGEWTAFEFNPQGILI